MRSAFPGPRNATTAGGRPPAFMAGRVSPVAWMMRVSASPSARTPSRKPYPNGLMPAPKTARRPRLVSVRVAYLHLPYDNVKGLITDVWTRRAPRRLIKAHQASAGPRRLATNIPICANPERDQSASSPETTKAGRCACWTGSRAVLRDQAGCLRQLPVVAGAPLAGRCGRGSGERVRGRAVLCAIRDVGLLSYVPTAAA